MSLKNLWKRYLYSLSSPSTMNTGADVLALLCSASIVGAAFFLINRPHITDASCRVVSLSVQAVVAFAIGVFMKFHGGKR